MDIMIKDMFQEKAKYLPTSHYKRKIVIQEIYDAEGVAKYLSKEIKNLKIDTQNIITLDDVIH